MQVKKNNESRKTKKESWWWRCEWLRPSRRSSTLGQSSASPGSQVQQWRRVSLFSSYLFELFIPLWLGGKNRLTTGACCRTAVPSFLCGCSCCVRFCFGNILSHYSLQVIDASKSVDSSGRKCHGCSGLESRWRWVWAVFFWIFWALGIGNVCSGWFFHQAWVFGFFYIPLLFAPSRDWYSSNLEIPFVSFSSTETCSAFRLPVELEVLCLWPPDCQSGRGVHVNDGGPTRISENGWVAQDLEAETIEPWSIELCLRGYLTGSQTSLWNESIVSKSNQSSIAR